MCMAAGLVLFVTQVPRIVPSLVIAGEVSVRLRARRRVVSLLVVVGACERCCDIQRCSASGPSGSGCLMFGFAGFV